MFDKFEPISCLKKDDYSSVYLANHVFLNKKIILKTLDTSNLPDNSVLHRFQREAKILARLEHPHIIRVLDFGMHEKHFYISFEYFESQNLRQAMREKAIPAEKLRDLIRQLFSGLEFAHQHAVVHRDIKPENVLVDEDGCLKIADFGLALLLNEDTMTHKSTIVGTPGYMSPEQIRGEELTLQSDLFSAGLLVYELFEGKNPLVGGDVGKTINAILKVNPERLIEEATALPDDIQDICLHLLQRDKRKRPENASSILQQLSTGELLGKPSGKFGMPVWLSGAFIVVLALGSSVMMFNNSAESISPPLSEQSVEPVITIPEASSKTLSNFELDNSEEIRTTFTERGDELSANSAERPAIPARKEAVQPKPLENVVNRPLI
ncbi:MAG: serine/threonine-protein kinase, partial [Calditrichota bacterium]